MQVHSYREKLRSQLDWFFHWKTYMITTKARMARQDELSCTALVTDCWLISVDWCACLLSALEEFRVKTSVKNAVHVLKSLFTEFSWLWLCTRLEHEWATPRFDTQSKLDWVKMIYIDTGQCRRSQSRTIEEIVDTVWRSDSMTEEIETNCTARARHVHAMDSS